VAPSPRLCKHLDMKRLSLSGLTMLMASCSTKVAEPPKNCAFAPPYFSRYGDQVAEGLETLPDLYTIYVPSLKDAAGNVRGKNSVVWNNRSVSLKSLDGYLAETGKLIPQPRTALNFPADAPCETVTKVRAMMEKHLDCKNSLACMQGFNEDKLPPEPPPTPR
jgi:hypothetical protein